MVIYTLLVIKVAFLTITTQLQSVDSLDTKASIVIGFAGVIIGISLNLYPHGLSACYNAQTGNPYLFGSSITLFLISIAFSFAAYKTESYRRDPEPRKLTVNYLMEKDDKKVKKQLIDNFIQSYEDNKIKIKKKVKYINYSLVLLSIGLILLTLSVFVG